MHINHNPFPFPLHTESKCVAFPARPAERDPPFLQLLLLALPARPAERKALHYLPFLAVDALNVLRVG